MYNESPFTELTDVKPVRDRTFEDKQQEEWECRYCCSYNEFESMRHM